MGRGDCRAAATPKSATPKRSPAPRNSDGNLPAVGGATGDAQGPMISDLEGQEPRRRYDPTGMLAPQPAPLGGVLATKKALWNFMVR